MELMTVVAREDNNTFNTFIAPSIQKHKLKIYQVGDKQAPDGSVHKNSTCEKYFMCMHGLKEKNMIPDDTLFVFVHEDVSIIDNDFVPKVLMTFAEKPDVGVLGVAGVRSILGDPKGLYDPNNAPVGHLIQGVGGKSGTAGKGNYIKYGDVGYFDNIMAVENSLFVVRGSVFNAGVNFDMQTFPKDMDMYGIDICFQAREKGFKVAVADILIYHHSSRSNGMSDSWKKGKELLNRKQYSFGGTSTDNNSNEVVEVEI
jgi:GT2 family glycosyltransferase